MLEGKAILVVEDEPMIAMMLEDLLGDLGCRIVGPAANLVDATELIERGPCDAAIVDLNLNGTMAHPLIETLVGQGVPVIVASGYGGDASGLPQGCRMVAKPYAMHEVEAALNDCFAA
ncbi:MAG TPA: response regulator [Bosea sp. (in: a-proteobacteria)]|uniref:response regulator n=1 Tax=Bosea sp. (in: a-proteobacteria) TaxID=1871050 RepID=UPI002DDC9D94|nr:response regulator [Bosea sp. (in: a-proteobacteria)]HEV2553020.1 response regulator [Bosea sp. (in: a-proteobacteria)]